MPIWLLWFIESLTGYYLCRVELNLWNGVLAHLVMHSFSHVWVVTYVNVYYIDYLSFINVWHVVYYLLQFCQLLTHYPTILFIHFPYKICIWYVHALGCSVLQKSRLHSYHFIHSSCTTASFVYVWSTALFCLIPSYLYRSCCHVSPLAPFILFITGASFHLYAFSSISCEPFIFFSSKIHADIS
jgi:hypothetical protein